MNGKFCLSEQNDTSLALDFLRALAAQTVCVGHAFNVFIPHATLAPRIGVVLFFVLSGFVIAHTLMTKSQDPAYRLPHFLVERFARIYTAYLPALILVALIDNAVVRSGLRMDITTLDWVVFLKNVVMLEGYPRAAAPAYGSAAQFGTVAIEFHIYFFVGALYFAWLGRNRAGALVLAAASCALPMLWLAGYKDPDRTLFCIWLLGFGAYLAAQRFAVPAALGLPAAALFAGLWFWLCVPGSEYALHGYPLFALSFLFLAMATQNTRVLVSHPKLAAAIKFAADYSYSLFLIHFTLEKAIAAVWTGPAWAGIATSIVVSNLCAAGFALGFERHYRSVAVALKRALALDQKHTDRAELARRAGPT
jgi:peptidoglycan/LPS O-acetylase OafA/YrhL